MAADLSRAIVGLARRLARLADADPGLMADLRVIVEAILAAERPVAPAGAEPARIEAEAKTEPAPPSSPVRPPAEPEAEPEAQAEAEPSRLAAVAPPPAAEPLRPLTFGRPGPAEVAARPAPIPAPADRSEITDADLPAILARCRLKAEGVRWAALRRRRLDQGADFRDEVAPKDREILDRARTLVDCYLWMNTPDFFPPQDPARIEDAAAGFEAVAAAVELIRGLLDASRPDEALFEKALDLLAEAQSALRVAVARLDDREDKDQYRAYQWLKATTAREQIYVRRHMRIGDPADPARLPAVFAEIDATDEAFQRSRRGEKRRKSGLGKLRYHAKLVEQGTTAEIHWPKVAEAVDELVASGIPASNPEIREALLPIIDESMPEALTMTAGFALALREVDRFLATQEAAPADAALRAPSAEVAEVARLLGGRSVVMIGGSRRPGAIAALEAAFGLRGLIWPETREHQSIEPFRPLIARPEVALVLLAIRWSNHSFGDLKRDCDIHGKPLVRLKAGYNPNQVAAQVLAQCGEQLKGP